jgi:hypothetical protein
MFKKLKDILNRNSVSDISLKEYVLTNLIDISKLFLIGMLGVLVALITVIVIPAMLILTLCVCIKSGIKWLYNRNLIQKQVDKIL